MSPRRLRPLPGLALVLVACSLVGGEDGEGGSSGGASAATGTPTTGDAVACLDVGDCPPAALCEHAACLDGLCTYELRPADERDDDQHGDCRSHVCDGAGVGTPIVDPSDVPVDDNSCTQDQCDPAGEPVNLPLAPGSRCDGGYCQSDLSCQPCAERSECIDDSAAEPNETQSNAHKLPNLNDDDAPNYLCEALGPGDVDWFVLDAFDLVLGKVEPALLGELEGLEACVYFQCKSAGTTVVCPEGTVAANAPLGQQGCCGLTDFAPDIDCGGGDEDATLWLRVAHAPDLPEPPPSCRAYQLGYEY